MPLSMLRAGQDPVDWRAFIDSTPQEVMFQIDPDGHVAWISANVREWLGIDPGPIVGTDLIARVHPDDRERILALRQRALEGHALSSIPIRVLGADGEYRSLQASARLINDAEGETGGLVITWRDIDFRVAVMRAFATLAEGSRVLLRARGEEELLQQMCEAAIRVGGYAFSWYGEPVDDEERSVRMVALAGDDMGYTKTLRTSWGDGPLAEGPTGLAIKTGTTQVRNDLASDPRFAPWLQQASARGIQCSMALPVRVQGQVHGALMVYAQDRGSFDDRALELLEALAADLGYGLERFQEAAALAASQEALQHEVAFDSLTGLAKKGLTLERIAEIIQTRHVANWALFCVGVDGLTAINQAFTHRAGDRVLREVADRLVQAAGAHDRVGRIAGDEFAVLLREVITPTDAAEAAQRLVEAVRGPIDFEGSRIEVSASAGIALLDGHDAESLMRDATAAMRRASRAGFGQWAFPDEDVAVRSRQALELQGQVRQSLAEGHITAWYMPVVDLETRAVQGYEALVRWIKPDGSVVPPDDFLPVSERSHLILDIDAEVLRQSVEALTRLAPDLHVAVNVSAPTLQAGHLGELVRGLLERTGVAPARLHLEVTETALLSVDDRVRRTMHELAGMGVVWWLDDFGTGYSSISHLRDLPIHGVKLDQTFTAGLLGGDAHASRLTRGLAGLADGLGLHTIAEGVETAEQAALLSGQGWECAQGWLFGRPGPLPA